MFHTRVAHMPPQPFSIRSMPCATRVWAAIQSKKEFEDKLNSVLEFSNVNHLNLETQRNICNFYAKKYPAGRIIVNEDEFLGELPPGKRPAISDSTSWTNQGRHFAVHLFVHTKHSQKAGPFSVARLKWPCLSIIVSRSQEKCQPS